MSNLKYSSRGFAQGFNYSLPPIKETWQIQPKWNREKTNAHTPPKAVELLLTLQKDL